MHSRLRLHRRPGLGGRRRRYRRLWLHTQRARRWRRSVWARRPRVRRRWTPALRRVHHDRCWRRRRAVFFYRCIALGAQAVQFHLPLRCLQLRVLVVAQTGGTAGSKVKIAPRARAFGRSGIGLRRAGGRRSARRLVALALGLALGLTLLGSGFGVQALLLFCQRLRGLGAFLGDFFGGLARLHLARLRGGMAGAIGVGDGAGARVGAAHHLR